MNNQYTREWIEENLPDFCFGRLSKEEESIFLGEVSKYPDLVDEVSNVNNLFSTLDKIDTRASYDSKLKNLSVKVLESYSYTQKNYFSRPSFMAIVSACVIGIVIFGYYTYLVPETQTTSNIVTSNSKVFLPQETQLPTEEVLNQSDKQTLLALDDLEEELITSSIQKLEPKTAFALTTSTPLALPTNSLKSLEENDIVDLLTTLENEDFSF